MSFLGGLPFHGINSFHLINAVSGYRLNFQMSDTATSDATRGRMQQIDLMHRTIHLLPGKTENSEGRVVKMPDEVYDCLRVCVEGKGSEDVVFNWGIPQDFRGSWARMLSTHGGSEFNWLGRIAVGGQNASRVTERTACLPDNIVAESDLAEAPVKLDVRRNGRITVTEQPQHS
jgi:hypothetical protein